MKKVLLLFGGNSLEHSVSCESAKSILKNIDYNKFEVTPVVLDSNNNFYIYDDEIEKINNWKEQKIISIDNIVNLIKEYDIVFPIIHGYGGEDGKLQGMLDLFNINYVGSNTLASAIGMDKEIAKIIFNYIGIPQVPFITIRKKYNIREIENIFDYPMIIKPANGGSSIGISKVNNKSELKKGLKNALNIDNKVIIEKFIKGRELECAILEKNKILVTDVGEILSDNEIYDYEAKYIKKSNTIVPCKINSEVKEKIQNYALKVFKFLNCKDLARIDFFYDEENNQIYLNEINTLPGFTEISMYPKLVMNHKISYQDLITSLLKK